MTTFHACEMNWNLALGYALILCLALWLLISRKIELLISELQAPGMRVEAELMASAPISTKPQAVPINDSSTLAMAAMPAAVNEEVQGKKCGFKWRGSMKIKQINRIYGDWLDDVPLVES